MVSHFILKLIEINKYIYLYIRGFLSTGDLASPGNYGLKDQSLVLRWIQENIKSFGGDKNSVTIFGQSAGAASVLYHMASPSSTGLFHKAIASSGSPLCLWAYSRDPKDIAMDIAVAAGIKTKNTKDMVSQLRKLDVEVLKRVSRLVLLVVSNFFFICKAVQNSHLLENIFPLSVKIIGKKSAEFFVHSRTYERNILKNLLSCIHLACRTLNIKTLSGASTAWFIFCRIYLRLTKTVLVLVPPLSYPTKKLF